MPQRTSTQLSFMMGVSFFALFLVGSFSAFPPPIRESPPWGKLVVGAVFALVCVLGITAVFFPAGCSRAIGHGRVRSSTAPGLEKTGSEPSVSNLMGLRLTHGHHPPCDRFASHEFRVAGKTFCTGCAGLLTGALAVLIGTGLYFFTGWQIDGSGYALLIAPGVLGVLFALLQFHVFNIQRTALRLMINAFFVVSTFLILVGLDLLVRSLTLDLVVISFSVFWLYTRISLSNWDHERICSSCHVPCNLRE